MMTFKKYQQHDQIFCTFEWLIKKEIHYYGYKLSGIFMDGKNTEKNS
jgi:hypothetical protein